MPSPNGYITSETVSNVTRNTARVSLGYDASQPPWTGTGQLASTTFEIGISSHGPAGPFTIAPLTGPSSECAAPVSNPVPASGTTATVFTVGGAASPGLADTDYWAHIVVRDGSTVLDDYVYGPVRTDAYPDPLCVSPTAVTDTGATVHHVQASGSFNVNAPCNQDTVVWEIAPSLTGPWTASPPEPVTDFTPEHTFSGLAPDTPYYYRARYSEQLQSHGEYLLTEACSFRTREATVTTPPPFEPQPCCDTAAGSGIDAENVILCDLDASGNLLGTALAVYDYVGGVPTGAPTFIDPVTGLPYVPQGTLQVCPDAACLPPMQFCQTETSTGPVEHPGRTYDITLPINQGFAVDSLTIDATSHPAGITWSIFDVDGSQFASDLQTFIQGRMPAGTTTTVTNPNAGATQICGAAQPMQIHIECARLDQSPPNLVELVYNGGQDLIQNAAYNEVPPFNLHQPCGFHLPQRQDAGGTLACTSVANRGWETNDSAQTFEVWCDDVRTAQSTTPTPRGTPVQEISSFGSGHAGFPATIWQTFNVPAAGTFNIRVIHGARDPGETHIIALSTGDVNDTQTGDVLLDTSTPPSVTISGGPNPWTTYAQTQALAPGIYTLSLSTTNPVGSQRGGLFTDMRVFLDRPGLRATATTDDETCVVTTTETQTTDTCHFWQPQCVGGVVAGWERTDTGERLTNAEFWAQVPTPKCCTATVEQTGGGGGTLSNMMASDIVCATVSGTQMQAIRYVVFDPSGGILQQSFISADGTPISPTGWNPGECFSERFVTESDACEITPTPGGDINVRPLREATTYTIDVNGNPSIVGVRYFEFGSTVPYTPVGSIARCDLDKETLALCDVQPGGGVVSFQRTWVYNDAGVFLAAYDTDWTGAPYTVTGALADCSTTSNEAMALGLCLSDGTPIGVITRRTPTGAVVEDGWINLITGAFSVGLPPVGTSSCSSSQSIQTSGVFCSVDDATQDVLELIIIEYHYAPDGSIDSVRLVNATTGATYVPPAGSSITVCPTGGEQSADRDIIVLCDTNGTVVTPFVRDFARNNLGQIIGHTDYTLANAPYTPTGTVGFCTPNTRDSETQVLCDNNAGVVTPFQRTAVRDPNGVIVTTLDQTLSGAPYTPTGTVGVCAVSQADAESVVLCDSASPTPNRFIRTYTYTAAGTVAGFTDTTLAGAPFTPTGAVGVCPVTGQTDAENQILCDSASPTPNRFLRSYTYSAAGAVTGFTDTTLAGAPFTPTGAVQVCPTTVQSDTDFVEEVLCDANGTAFIRLFRFNSATGVLISTTNTTLTGAAFTPVGTVGLCSSCCPQVIGEGCTNTGSGFYTAIRGTNGTVTLIDSVSGATITSGNIIACPAECTTASSIGTICYTPPVAVATLQDDWTGASSAVVGPSRVWTNSNFADQGIIVTETVTPDTSATLLFNGVRNTATSPATQHTAIDLGAPRNNVVVRMDYFGSGQGERLRNITPAFTSVSGNGTSVLANTGIDGGPAGDGTIFITFAGPVQNIAWDYSPTGSGLSGQSFISFNSSNAANSAQAAVLRNCQTNATTLVDLATGTVLNPATISIVDCPGEGDVVPVTLNSQGRLVADADAPWTPGADVVGTLTSVTLTVLSGTATVIDQSGTTMAGLPAGYSATWTAEDGSTLLGPQSIDAIGGNTAVVWTQRA